MTALSPITGFLALLARSGANTVDELPAALAARDEFPEAAPTRSFRRGEDTMQRFDTDFPSAAM